MAKELSPKKYLETRVRQLPIYKCYVNKGWEEARMARVIVLRKHSNGNVTTGIYLVDLACLGIKDTFFTFNQSEEITNENINSNDYLEPIDYNLAHNIVYAGHDYALDLEIKPHPDFAITKFILEEDDDDIPLIDISVGGIDGKPNLILQPGQAAKYRHVYDKLMKNLGKDNFNYMIGLEPSEDDDFEDDTYYSRYGEETFIDDYELGDIKGYKAKQIHIGDLANMEKVSKRTLQEILILGIELQLRVIEMTKPYLFDSREELENQLEYVLYEDGNMYPEWMTDKMLNEANQLLDSEIVTISESDLNNNTYKPKLNIISEVLLDHIKKYSDNPYVLQMLYEIAVLKNDKEAQNVLNPIIKKLASQYVSAKLELALCTYYLNETDPSITYIIEESNIEKIFPQSKEFNDVELHTFSMLKLLINMRKGNLKEAIYYYNFMAEVNKESPMLTTIQIQFRKFLTGEFNEALFELDDKAN